VDSLTLNFDQPEFFAFGDRASNQVWVVTRGDVPAGAVPSGADCGDKKVTFHFSPPLTLSTDTDQTTNTCYFGLISLSSPEVTTAIISGTAQDPVYGSLSFKAKVQAQTP
jgi:hypothetical protein